ncbi:MAG: cytidine deaminase [Thermoprotei archaeon]|jgi:cytidine deaminase
MDLAEIALNVMKNAYAPYSNFKVGAVVRTKRGSIYTGVNVENSSYGLTICAERVAIFKAISEGDKEIEEIVVAAESEKPVAPCGACRQVIAEFNPHAKIIMINNKGMRKETTLDKLLPDIFKLKEK